MTQFGPTPDEAQHIARSVGCRVTRTHHLFDGENAYQIECPTHRAKVRLLSALADYDAATPDVRRAAEYIAAGATSAWGQIAALHAYVRDHVVFTREPVETFSPTMHVLEVGAGDCDDSARALVALLRSLGHHADVATLGDPPQHAAAAVHYDGEWRWLEATIDARPGEHPIDAAKRLGVKMRPDLVAQAMGALAHRALANPHHLGDLQLVRDLPIAGWIGAAGIGAATGVAATWASGGSSYAKGAIAGAAAVTVLAVALGIALPPSTTVAE